MANRIYFANQQVAFKRDGVAGGAGFTAAHGVQSVAVTTTFNLEQAFELGQLSIYENIEGVPDIEITASKVLDGYPLLYHLATQTDQSTSHGPGLAGRSNAKVVVALGIWPDTNDSATGTPSTQMEASGMFASSVSYNFPLEDNFTEDITLVGNNKGWNTIDAATAIGCANPPWPFNTVAGQFDNTDVPKASGTNAVGGGVTASQEGGVNRRENLAFNLDYYAVDAGGVDYTLLPTQIPGVSSSGWIES